MRRVAIFDIKLLICFWYTKEYAKTGECRMLGEQKILLNNRVMSCWTCCKTFVDNNLNSDNRCLTTLMVALKPIMVKANPKPLQKWWIFKSLETACSWVSKKIHQKTRTRCCIRRTHKKLLDYLLLTFSRRNENFCILCVLRMYMVRRNRFYCFL